MNDFDQDTDHRQEAKGGGLPKRKQGKYVHVMIPADLYDALCSTAQDLGIVKRGAWHVLIRRLLPLANIFKSLFSSDL